MGSPAVRPCLSPSRASVGKGSTRGQCCVGEEAPWRTATMKGGLDLPLCFGNS